MEEESFDDEEIAAELNQHYVAIKVDRERRPDVDAVYMAAVQMMAGNGGWPMTVWLTPDRKPFYGGTYFPARDGDRGVRFGFLTLLRRVYAIYAENPDRAAAAAADLAGRVREQMASASGEQVPGPDVLRSAFAELGRTFDATHGGFGGAPRFPRPLELQFLLRHHRRTGDPPALRMAVQPPEAMAARGRTSSTCRARSPPSPGTWRSIPRRRRTSSRRRAAVSTSRAGGGCPRTRTRRSSPPGTGSCSRRSRAPGRCWGTGR